MGPVMSASTAIMNENLLENRFTTDVTTSTNESFVAESEAAYFVKARRGRHSRAWIDLGYADVTTGELILKTRTRAERTVSPFETVDEKNEIESRELLRMARLLPRQDAAGISNRLEELLDLSVENDDIRVMPSQSLHFFLNFMAHNIRLGTPLIFLLESGYVRAEWRVSPKEAIAIEFRPDGNVDFVSISPRLGRPTSTQVSSAENISWRSVIDSIQQGSDLTWLWV